jgi:hypothetical protein
MDDRGSVKRCWPIALAAALLAAPIAWLTPARSSTGAPARSPALAATSTAVAARPPPHTDTRSRAPARPEAARSPAPVIAQEQPEGLHHPITPEHARLYRDVDLLDDAWQALKASDYAGARAALARHRSEYPSAHDDLNEGLSLLADCVEEPSDRTRARALRFYEEHTYSMARRRIRRECLQSSR